MSVVICDTDGEVWYKVLDELDMYAIEMPYSYNNEVFYYDSGRNTDFKRFYDAIRGGDVPKTMALNPDEYVDILEKFFSQGEDVIYVSFSHQMSGTFNSLDLALQQLKEKYPERKCTVFDTKSICLGAGIQMEYAGTLKQQGVSDEQLLQKLKEFSNKACIAFVVDDLMHLKRGGRLSGFAAFAGTMLSLKPLLTTDEKGSLKVIEKISGRKKSIRRLADMVAENLTETEYKVYVVDADCPEDGEMLAQLIKEKRPDANVVRQTVGPVIGAHCGPGTLGVIYVGNQRIIPIEE